MRSKEEILTDFRQIVQEWSQGETTHNIADRMQSLLDEFSALGFGPNVSNYVGSNTGYVAQVGNSSDPYEAISQTILYLRTRTLSAEDLISWAPQLSGQIDRLSGLTRGGSVSNYVGSNEGTVIQAGTIDGNLDMRNW